MNTPKTCPHCYAPFRLAGYYPRKEITTEGKTKPKTYQCHRCGKNIVVLPESEETDK